MIRQFCVTSVVMFSLTFPARRPGAPLPAYFIQPRRVLEALREELTPVGEEEPLPGQQVPHGVRQQDVAPDFTPED